MSNKIKAVLFDMDGTLFDTETTSIFAWAVAGRKFGLDIPKDFMPVSYTHLDVYKRQVLSIGNRGV